MAMAIGVDHGILVETGTELQPLVVTKPPKVLTNREQLTLILLGKQVIDSDAN